jgi:uncharacterized phage-associated protein
MQKLVYYAQGVHLAITGKRLFDEDIVAWEHGPVVPSLYHELKQFSNGAISLDFEDCNKAFTLEQLDILKDVYNVYGQFSAWALRDKTHEESPWILATGDGKVFNRPISDESMIDYFRTQLVKN